MGAFFLYKTHADIDLRAVQDCFAKKGFSNPVVRDLGLYTLWLYKKTRVDIDNYIETEKGSIYAVGTVIYRGHDYQGSLKRLLNDVLNKKLNFDELIGSFFILVNSKAGNHILTDLAGTQCIFYDIDKKVVSSSFLAALFACNGTFSLNKMAITEILATGSLIGPDTVINEIRRFMIRSSEAFEGLELVRTPPLSQPDFCRKNYQTCLDNQIEILEDYFKNIKTFSDSYGLNSGLTSGLDSRLLLVLIKRHLSNFQFYTTWRKFKNKDFLITEKLAREAGQDLIIIPVTPPLDMSQEQALKTLQQSFLFFDGRVRTHHLWTEEINTREYRESLLQDKLISVSGIGGEQYRNNERMIRNKWNLTDWVENDLIYRYAGDSFKNQKDKNHFLAYYVDKIKCRLRIQERKQVDHFTVKRYFNEIYNPANRTVRMNIENQIGFFLCPFAEFKTSQNAYAAIPHLGPYLRFEADMINKLSPKLAAIETHYRTNLLNGDSLRNLLMTYIKELLPKHFVWKLYHKRRPHDTFYEDYEKRFAFVRENTRLLFELNLPIDLTKIKKNPFLSPLLISMGYFLNKIKNKISF